LIRPFLEQFDPRAKFMVLLTYLPVFFLPLPILMLTGYLAAMVFMSLISLGPRGVIRPFLSILPILLLVLLLTPPFQREGEPFIVISGRILVTTGGINEALRLIIRFSGITLLFYLFANTTNADIFITSCYRMGMPFNLVLVVTIAMRYIPHLTTLYREVTDAHSLRKGADGVIRGFSPLRRVKALLPVLTSVLIQAIRQIPVLSMALECRGVGRRVKRSTYLELKNRAGVMADFSISLLIILILLIPLIREMV
jgi:energy-coupling factor transport system permease protein